MVQVLGVVLVLGGCAALARATWVLRRPAPEAERLRPLTAARAALLDRALADLAGRSAAVLRVGDEEVAALAGGDPAHPWRRDDGGWWVAAAGDLAPAGAAAPYAAWARLARDGGRDVLVDLAGAPGLVALVGDVAAARRAALGAVRDLLARTAAADLEVCVVPDAAAALDLAGPVPPDQGEQVLVGRGAPVRDRRLRLLVLLSPPGAADADRLTALVESAEASLAVLVVGDCPRARWRLCVDAAGVLDLGVLAPVPQGSA